MATTQHRPHGAFAGPVFGTLEGKTEDTGPTANPITQHRPHGAFTGQRYGTLSGKGASTAATISAATASPTGGTTADIGCTTDTASGALWALVRIGGSPAADTAIEAGGQSAAVSTTTPSIAYTGLTAATGYSVDIVQKVGGVYSNVITATFTTDNTGSGGGSLNEVNPSSGALRFTGYAPTIARTTNQWVAPTTGAFRFTGYAPTIERTGSIEVIPQSGALRFTGYMPVVVVSAGGNQTIEPASGALRFTGYAPTVENVGVSFTSAGVLYVPIRMVSSLWSAGNVGGAAGEVAWLPPARQPMVYTDTRTGQMFCDPAWYRFFEYIAETRLAGKTGPTLTSVVQTLTDTQTTAAAATVTVTELQQQTQANAEALYVTREVVKYGGLPGAEQIPFVEL